MQPASAIRKVAFLGDYLPRKCGIATFTTDLRCAVAAEFPAMQCLVVPVNDLAGGYDYPAEVRFEIAEQDLPSYLRAADFLNITDVDVVCVEHEFGIFGGPAGSHVLALLRELQMPIVTTLHTVLREPNAEQRRVMRELIRLSTRLVVMSERGREFLRDVYQAPAAKIDLIPHGIPDMPFADPNYFKDEFGVAGKQVLLTFGLLSPNKGIEYALRALPDIIREFPNVVYIVLGQTHPNLLRDEGEAYRLSLERLAKDLGVQKHVVFFNRFVELEELMRFIGAADIYLTPYLTESQITSGTLAYAFGAGNAVVSTPYWHAAELLTAERGKLVPFRDAKAIAVAVVELLRDEPLRHSMRKNAYKLGRDMVWSRVAQLYAKSFEQARQDHSFVGTKIVAHQDARRTARTIAGVEAGSSVSDERFDRHFPAREFHRAEFCRRLLHGRQRPRAGAGADAAKAGARFAATRRAGRHLRRVSQSRLRPQARALPQLHELRPALAGGSRLGGLPGSRAVGAGVVRVAGGPGQFSNAGGGTVRTGAARGRRVHVAARAGRSRSSALTNTCGGSAATGARTRFANRSRPNSCSATPTPPPDDWHWFEEVVSYANAKLPHAMILNGRCLNNGTMLELGLKTLRWLTKIQTSDAGSFRPIGSNGFFPRGKERAIFDQQPIEAQVTISACIEAYQATGDMFWVAEARRAFEWFLGRNDLGLALYDSTTGGCRDGLHVDRLSQNQGAESTLAFLLSLAEMQALNNSLTSFKEPNGK